MKKFKKHHFTHRDPEGIKTETPDTNETTGRVTVKSADSLSSIKRDLRKTALIITSFLAILVILYIIQQKTGLLSPVLRLFGL